jgi:hypothetical protein
MGWPVSCPLSGSASLLNFNPVFPNFSFSGLDFEGVNARLVRCVVPVLLPIQVSCPLSGSASSLNFNPYFSKFNRTGWILIG